VSRLPIPGGDDSDWGNILNDFLSQSLSGSGGIKSEALASAGAELTANKGQVNGYAPLGSSAMISPTYLGTGSASTTTFLAGDNTWQTVTQVASGVGDYLGVIGGTNTVSNNGSSGIYGFDEAITQSNGTSISWDGSTPQEVIINETGVYGISVTVYWEDQSTIGGFDTLVLTTCAFRAEDQRPAFTDGQTSSIQHVATTLYLQQGQNISVYLNQTTDNATLTPQVWILVTRVA
jgi:hypothetical protein